MNEQDRNTWLARCWKCTQYKPRKKTLHCELAAAIRAGNEIATENIEKFTDKYGVCKQYEPID